MKLEKNGNAKFQGRVRPVVTLAVIFLIICGLAYPLLITGIGQAFLPYQANGEQVHLNGQVIGSNLIAQNFTGSEFFHYAVYTKVDPDITVQQAYAQVSRISMATGIPANSLLQIINKNIIPASRLLGIPYVNVLTLNLELIKTYPSIYGISNY